MVLLLVVLLSQCLYGDLDMNIHSRYDYTSNEPANLPFLKVLYLFIRNKIVEAVPIIGIIILTCLVFIGIYFGLYGLGWLMCTYLPASWGLHLNGNDITQGAYVKVPIILIISLALIILLIVVGYNICKIFIEWITENWRLAKRGIKL